MLVKSENSWHQSRQVIARILTTVFLLLLFAMDLTLVFLLFLIGVMQVTTIPIFGTLEPTSTTPYSHITSYLKQRRSDSRADKPDEFPNFDFDISTTTKRPVTRVQVYKRVVGKVVEDIRDRVTSAIVQGQIDKQNSNKFGQRLQDVVGKNDTDGNESDEFIGLSLDEDDTGGPTIIFETSNHTTEVLNGTELPEYSSTDIRNFTSNFLAAKFKNKTRAIATIVFPPLLNIWTTAQRNLHFPSTTTGEASNNLLQQHQQQQQQKAQQSTGNVQTWITNGIKRNLRGMPFRNAFYKYSNLVEKGSYNESVDNPFAGNSEAPHSSDLAEIEVRLDNEGLDDDEDKPSESGKLENHNIGSVGRRLMFNEGFGIYVLEIIGTIVGLTWGAINQIQNIFGNRQ